MEKVPQVRISIRLRPQPLLSPLALAPEGKGARADPRSRHLRRLLGKVRRRTGSGYEPRRCRGRGEEDGAAMPPAPSPPGPRSPRPSQSLPPGSAVRGRPGRGAEAGQVLEGAEAEEALPARSRLLQTGVAPPAAGQAWDPRPLGAGRPRPELWSRGPGPRPSCGLRSGDRPLGGFPFQNCRF